MTSTRPTTLTQAMQGFFGMGKPEEKQQSVPDMFAANPYIKAFQDMIYQKSIDGLFETYRKNANT